MKVKEAQKLYRAQRSAIIQQRRELVKRKEAPQRQGGECRDICWCAGGAW